MTMVAHSLLGAILSNWEILWLLSVVCCASCSGASTSLTSYGYVNQTVEAVVGDVAELRCNTKNSENATLALVIWYQENVNSPICSMDKRSGARLQYTLPLWNSTVSHQLSEKDDLSILTLRPVKPIHQGLYRCRVDFRKSPTRDYIINVSLIVPPQKLNIFDDRGNELRNNHIGPYKENATVTITCAASGGSPPPRVTWFRGTELIPGHVEQLPDGTVQNSLKLNRLNRKDLYAAYSCQASNNELSSLTSSVIVNMTLSPQSVKLFGADKSMSVGRRYEISCHVYGANPSPIIKWTKGNDKMKNYEKSDSNDGNLTISRLSFFPQPEDDGKVLSCLVDSTAAASSAGQFSDSQKLHIVYKPMATIRLGKNLNASAVNEGSDVYFDCNCRSSIPVTKIIWKLDGKLLRHNPSAGVLTQDNLVLQKVSRWQSGMYSCVASNAEGDGESDSIHLDVKFAPVCYSSSLTPTEYGVDRGEKVSVKCEVEANPTSITFEWEFTSEKTKSSSSPIDFTANGTESYIEFQPNSENDYGVLQCKARNSVGTQKQSCIYKIYPAGKPEVMSGCTVTNKTTSSLLIKCIAGFDGGSRQRFVAEIYRQSTQNMVQNISNDSPEFLVTGLQADVDYDFLLYAFNNKGRSQTIEFNETLGEDDKDFNSILSPSKLSPMLNLSSLLVIVVILIGTLVLLSCCIGMVIIRSHDNRRRKKHYVYKSKESLEKNPDIIPNRDDGSCALEITAFVEEKHQHPSKQTDISLILQNSYGTDMNSDFILHREDYSNKLYKKKTSSLRKLNEYEITYASCDQPCPPFVTQETPLLSSSRVPFIAEGQHAVQCCIHGLSRSTSIS